MLKIETIAKNFKLFWSLQVHMCVYAYRTLRACLNFIDFQKAFDSVDHQVLWEILGYYGIQHKVISTIQQLHGRFTCQVTHGRTETDPFTVSTGVRKGCLLSPFLFLLVIDQVSRTPYGQPNWHTVDTDIRFRSSRLATSRDQPQNNSKTGYPLHECPENYKVMRINAN